MTPPQSTLRTTPPEGIVTLLEQAGRDARVLLQLSSEIYDLDPFVDALALTDVRGRLRMAVLALRDEQSSGAPALATGRALLDLVSGRQTPVASGLRELLQTEPEHFTAALVRALWSVNDRSRTASELDSLLRTDAAREFVFGRLVELGALLRLPADPSRPWRRDGYRLTPAAAGALPAIAKHVLDFELGRFPWPEAVPHPKDWLDDLVWFEHGGRDGDVVRQRVGQEPSTTPSLSLPNLRGIGRERQPLDRDPRHMSIALLYDPMRQLDTTTARRRLEPIVADQRSLQHYAGEGTRLQLMLFADPEMNVQLQRQLLDYCRAQQVEAHFPVAA